MVNKLARFVHFVLETAVLGCTCYLAFAMQDLGGTLAGIGALAALRIERRMDAR